MLVNFVLFGVLGLLGTVTYTGVRGAIAKRSFDLTGEASLILAPAFGLIAVLYPMIAVRLGAYQWYVRGVVLMLAFYTCQYIVGQVLTKLRACPWSYPPGGSIHGLVRISDAPAWFLAGLAVEWAYPYVQLVARVIS